MPEPVTGDRKRVVIADDDDDIRGLMTIAASRAGVEIVAAVDNGRAALDAVRSGGVDLAVLDISMPGLNGVEVAEAVEPEDHVYDALIARLRAQQGPDADAAWLDRELDAAVRARALVSVEVGMPDGSSRELVLEATGLGGGRLRGRDRAADVERTLPVRSIRSVRVLEE